MNKTPTPKLGFSEASINGVPLTFGQAMTFRIAVTAFLVDMRENGLGEDEEGITVAKINENNCLEIIKLISDRNQKNDDVAM
jgi:hypothetical protein